MCNEVKKIMSVHVEARELKREREREREGERERESVCVCVQDTLGSYKSCWWALSYSFFEMFAFLLTFAHEVSHLALTGQYSLEEWVWQEGVWLEEAWSCNQFLCLLPLVDCVVVIVDLRGERSHEREEGECGSGYLERLA